MKQALIPLLPAAVDLESKGALLGVDCDTWHMAGDTQCEARMAYDEKYLHLAFKVSEPDLRAVNVRNLSPVADDSCVELFMQLPGSAQYWNFEFNCIGAVNASHRVTRPNPVRLTDEQIALIKRQPSLGRKPFELLAGQHTWQLSVSIPWALVNDGQVPTSFRANLYCCGGKTMHPHYLSWSPIVSPKPNFHLPEFFGQIQLAGA